MSDVATAWVSVAPSAKGFGSKLDSEIGPSINASGNKHGLGFGKLFAAGAALGIGTKLVGFIGNSIGAASDLNETISKTKVVFGDAAKEIEAFADKGPAALGQTKTEALAAASTFGTFGKAAGLSGKDLAGFSTDLVGLSADLASFHNATPEEAVTALGAALRGESEPIRRFGVLLDDMSLRNEALRLGLTKTTKDALTPQQKTLAAQSLIMKQTKDAQGDFARTSDGLANSQRILSAEFGNLSTKVGSFFLPIAEKVVHWGIDALKWLQGLGPVLSQVGGFFASAFGGGNGAAVSGFFATLQNAAATILPVIANTFQTVVLPAILAFATYVSTSLYPVFLQVVGIIRDNVIPIITNLATFFYGTLVPAIYQIVGAVAEKLKPVFDQLVATFRESVLPTVKDLLVKFEEWQPTIQKVVLVMAKIIGKVLEFAAAILAEVLPPAIKFAGWLISTLVPAISTVIGWVVNIIGKAIDLGAKFVDAKNKIGEFVTGAKEKISEFLKKVENIPGDVKDAFTGAKDLLVEVGKDIVRGLTSGLDQAKQWVIDKVQELADLVPGWLKKKLGIHSPSRVTQELGRHTADGFAKGLQDRKQHVLDTIQGQIDGWLTKLDTVKGSMTQLADSVASAFKVDLFSGTLGDLFANGNASLANLKEVQAAFDTLTGKKDVNKAFLSSLYQSGNSALILELAKADDQQLADAQAIFQKQEDLAAQLGADVGMNQFGDRIAEVREEIKGLRQDKADLAKLTGEALAEALKKYGSDKKRKRK